MITVGLSLIGDGRWSGGKSYLRNMLGVMSEFLADRVEAKLFLSPQQAEKIGDGFNSYLACPPIVDEIMDEAGTSMDSVFRAFAVGRDTRFAKLAIQHDVDLFWETAQWFGNGFPVPVLSWLPDFQHRKLPHLFPKAAWWKRDIGFRVQTSGKRTIVLSSEDSRTDCETFYPASRGKTCTIRFAVDPNFEEIIGRAQSVLSDYELPRRIFFLPNQLWKHKNHSLVVEALKVLRSQNQLADIPPIVLTGRKQDPRDPQLGARLFAEVEKHNLQDHFRHLGLIPYQDVLALNACCELLLNPSLFEGWSTTVEEAKALGTPMLLSDIPLHQEQAPDALFFARNKAEDLAEQLLLAAQTPKKRLMTTRELESAHWVRRSEYAEALSNSFLRSINHSGSN